MATAALLARAIALARRQPRRPSEIPWAKV